MIKSSHNWSLAVQSFSESVIRFAKSLFATFLGLVMALGLNNWNQARIQRQAAQAALASVLRETESNRQALHKLALANQDLPRNLGLTIAALESLQEARSSHRPWVMPQAFGDLSIHHTAGNLKSSAWGMALADQSVQLFPKAQAEDLANFYQQLGRLQAFLDQPVDYTPISALGGITTAEGARRRLERFSPAELERILWNLRELKVRFELAAMWAEGVGEVSLPKGASANPSKS